MISFVVYFSTAEDAVGYVLLDGYGTAVCEFAGGAELQPGEYRVDQGRIVRVQTPRQDPQSNPRQKRAANWDACAWPRA
jgi:hypothetical protein